MESYNKKENSRIFFLLPRALLWLPVQEVKLIGIKFTGMFVEMKIKSSKKTIMYFCAFLNRVFLRQKKKYMLKKERTNLSLSIDFLCRKIHIINKWNKIFCRVSFKTITFSLVFDFVFVLASTVSLSEKLIKISQKYF